MNTIFRRRVEKEVHNIIQPFTAKNLRIFIIEKYGTNLVENNTTIGYILSRMDNVEQLPNGEWRVIND
jgi:hypothetical protein